MILMFTLLAHFPEIYSPWSQNRPHKKGFRLKKTKQLPGTKQYAHRSSIRMRGGGTNALWYTIPYHSQPTKNSRNISIPGTYTRKKRTSIIYLSVHLVYTTFCESYERHLAAWQLWYRPSTPWCGRWCCGCYRHIYKLAIFSLSSRTGIIRRREFFFLWVGWTWLVLLG